MYSVVFLAAGSGSRTGKSTPKQFLPLAGKPLLMHSLERVDNFIEINEIIIVCMPEYKQTIEDFIKKYRIMKTIKFADGGQTRQESVYNALKICTCLNVIIHEAARPFVSQKDFKRLIDDKNDNVTLSYPIPFTVLKTDNQNYISDTLNRDELVNIQLPQKFNLKKLLESHEFARRENRVFTEDASLLYHYTKEPISCLRGGAYNIKITEYIDFLMGEIVYKELFSEEELWD